MSGAARKSRIRIILEVLLAGLLAGVVLGWAEGWSVIADKYRTLPLLSNLRFLTASILIDAAIATFAAIAVATVVGLFVGTGRTVLQRPGPSVPGFALLTAILIFLGGGVAPLARDLEVFRFSVDFKSPVELIATYAKANTGSIFRHLLLAGGAAIVCLVIIIFARIGGRFRSTRAVAGFAALTFAMAAATTINKLVDMRGEETGILKEDRPDILLVVVDTLRADRLGAYGYPAPTSPNMDRLARKGMTVTLSQCPSPLTLPSHASLFTGRSPGDHGVVFNLDPLADKFTTLPELLRESGYRTAAFVSSFAVDGRFGLKQGFEVYDDAIFPYYELMVVHYLERAFAPGKSIRAGSRTVERAVYWLEESPEEPVFLWVHLIEPHAPYDAPKYLQQRFHRVSRKSESQTHRNGDAASLDFSEGGGGDLHAAYDAEVSEADRALGPLFAAFQRRAGKGRSLTVLLSDHGEGLGEHDEPYHGDALFDTTTRVPLILSARGLEPGSICTAPLRVEDIAPTLLGLAEISFDPDDIRGQDLSLVLRGSETGGGNLLLARTNGKGVETSKRLRSIRNRKLKLVLDLDSGERSIFDLLADPRETTNLESSPSEVHDHLESVLRNEMGEDPSEGRGESRLTREEEEKLRALGYLE